MSQAGGGGGATAFSAFAGMSAAKAGAADNATAATAASVNFFIVQPLPVVCGSGRRLTSRTVSRITRTRQQASTTRPPAPPIIMAKIQHAYGACDKLKRSAT